MRHIINNSIIIAIRWLDNWLSPESSPKVTNACYDLVRIQNICLMLKMMTNEYFVWLICFDSFSLYFGNKYEPNVNLEQTHDKPYYEPRVKSIVLVIKYKCIKLNTS